MEFVVKEHKEFIKFIVIKLIPNDFHKKLNWLFFYDWILIDIGAQS